MKNLCFSSHWGTTIEVITKHEVSRKNICASRKDRNGENCTPRSSNISSSPSTGKITGLMTEWSALLQTLTQTVSKHTLLH